MANKLNILVVGANGQLGREIRNLSVGMSDNYYFADVTEIPGEPTLSLDAADEDAVRAMVRELDINVIINCAAYTDVERAETDPDICTLLNVDVPKLLASVMKESEGLLVHISTDYVFDGQRHNYPYTEEDSLSPINVYGKTKAEGERQVVESGCGYIILRTSWLYSEYGKNFLKTMLNLFSQRSQIKVVSDQIGSPTYALDLAEAICHIIENRKYQNNTGIYHYSGGGECSWYDFAVEISRIDGNSGCQVCPCSTVEYQTKAARPAYSVLDKSKIVEIFGVEIPCWKDSLARCYRNIKIK